jgi:hypothetical protein
VVNRKLRAFQENKKEYEKLQLQLMNVMFGFSILAVKTFQEAKKSL